MNSNVDKRNLMWYYNTGESVLIISPLSQKTMGDDLMTSKTKTLLCVAMAGLMFIPAILFNMKHLLIVGAFFDWLPLMTKWMKFEGGKLSRGGLLSHIVLTLVAYAILLVWVFTSAALSKFLFLEIWWIAVVSGNFIYES